MRERLEYAVVWLLVRGLAALPRPLARGAAMALALCIYAIHRRLRRVGMRNLEIAFPEKNKKQRRKILRALYINLGRQLAEFCRFPKYTKENVSEVIIYEGFENFQQAEAAGKGVLFLTG